MNNKPYFSFVCLLSRPDNLKSWIANVQKLKLPRFATEVVFLLDTKNPEEYRELYDAFRPGSWQSVLISYTDNEPCSPVNVMARRKRITDNMVALQAMTGDSQFVFGLEDDTYPPKEAFERLHRVITNEKVGFVSGIEVGRWNLPYIGAWKADKVVGTTRLKSLSYRESHLEEVDAAGLYCYITKTRHFKQARFTDDRFGPDINYVLSLRRSGNRAYVDWDVKCGHLVENTNRMLYPDENCANVSLIKEGDYYRVESHTPFIKQ